MGKIEKLIIEKKKKKEKIILELGPGEKKFIPEAIGIDTVPKESVDVIFNLNNGIPIFEKEVVDEIYAFHFVEHINNIEFLFKEIHRVLKKNGKFIFTVPHFSNPYYSDYTHKNFWGLYTVCYFTKNCYFRREVPRYYNEIDFILEDIKLRFFSPFKYRNILKKIFEKLFNFNSYFQELYEEFFVYFIPCYEIFIILKKQ